MVHIVADTTSSIPPEIAKQYGIPLIPQIIYFGEQSFVENVDIDNATFMQKLKASVTLPRTAAPEPEWFIKEFERLAPTGETILCIHPSTDVSGTVRSALTAKEEFPGVDIRVIDTRLVATPLGSVVECAVRWAQAGLDADEIEKRVMEMSARARLYGMVDTLEFLAKGGRIGGAAAFLGSMLQIKPIVTFTDGKVDQFDKERTHRRAYERLKSLVCEQYPKDGEGFLAVFHAAVPEEAGKLADELKMLINLQQVPVRDVPPAIATHTGPGLLGVSFFVSR